MIEQTNALTRRAFLGGAAVIGAGCIASTFNPLQAFAVTAAEKKAEASAALEKLDAVQAKLNAAEADYQDAVYEQQQAQALMDDAQVRIDEATIRIGDLQDHLSTRARSMYRSGSLSFVDMLLGATSFQAFTTNWGILNDMNQSDADMVGETKVLRTEVEEQKKVYEEQEAVAAEKAEKAAEVKAEAEVLVSEMQATYNSLSAEAEQLIAAEEAARESEKQRQAQVELTKNKNSASSANNSKPQRVSGNSAISRGYAYEGTKYVLGGGGPDSFDCSGFVSYCLTGQFGRQLGTTKEFASYPQVTDPQPGDICWQSDHVGLYIGNGQMIHASLSKGQVVVSSVLPGMIYRRY